MPLVNNNSTSDQQYLDLLSNVDVNPVFILGDHRSGTTLLYKTLVATGCFNYVKAYHIIKYGEILSNHICKTEKQAIQNLEDLFVSLGIDDRTIDKVTVTPDLPEEYGFILKNIYQNESFITLENIHIFQELCRKIQLTSAPEKPLLLKNPWDYPRFIHVKKLVPNAKFIFIHRHPIHVINSKLKATRTLLSSWNEYTALISQMYTQVFKSPLKRFIYQVMYAKTFNLGLHRVAKQSEESTNYFLENVQLLPKRDYLSIKYEGLCKDPEAEISKILKFLNQESVVPLAYENLIQAQPLNLLPEIARNYDVLCQKLQPCLTYHGYKA